MEVVVEGIKYHENLIKIMQLQVPFISQSFVKDSVHFVGDNGLKKTKNGMTKIGLFEQEDPAYIEQACKNYNIDVIQLQGDVTDEFISSIRPFKKKIWLELPIDEYTEFDSLTTLNTAKIDAFVFNLRDTSDFPDWFILEAYTGDLPFFIKGNIGLRNLYTLENFQNNMCKGVFINEAFESIPGIKNGNLVATFQSNLKQMFP